MQLARAGEQPVTHNAKDPGIAESGPSPLDELNEIEPGGREGLTAAERKELGRAALRRDADLSMIFVRSSLSKCNVTTPDCVVSP